MGNGDPIPVADDVCEILHRDDWSSHLGELTRVLVDAGPLVDGVLAEVARRGLLQRLLPDGASADNARLLEAIVGGASDEDALALLAGALIGRGGEYDRVTLNDLVLRAQDLASLPSLFAGLVGDGRYEALVAMLTAEGRVDSPALRALAAARPDYGAAALNAPALAFLHGGGAGAGSPFELLIVPGFTPLGATVPTALKDLPAACRRLDTAVEDFKSGRAPCLLVSGGSVHPPGTPLNEALMMRDYLVGEQVPAERILVDPHARHSTTNLRNAGRLMRQLGLGRGLIVTGYESNAFSQAFYFAHSCLSTFDSRCQEELGYFVGQLDGIDDHHIGYAPSPDVDTPNWADPIDC